MMMKLVLAIALVASASALPSLDTPEVAMVQMTKAAKDAKATVSKLLESGSDSSACAELATTLITEVEDSVKAAQEILDKFASPNNGEHCLTEGKESVDAAESALSDATTKSTEAAAAASAAAGADVDFGAVSLGSLSEEDGAVCGPFGSDADYVAKKAAAAAGTSAAAEAAAAIAGFEDAVATAKEAAAAAVRHCQCVTYTDYTAAYATATAHADSEADAYAKGKHMECVLAGTSPADCDVGTTPAVTAITLADGVSAGSCEGVDLDGPEWQHIVSTDGNEADDALITVSCPDDLLLTGCECHSWWDTCDGAYAASGKQCVAHQGGGNKVTAQAICAYYKDKTAADVSVVAGPWVGGDDSSSQASCPDGSRLTGCSCESFWKACDGAMFSSEQCVAFAGDSNTAHTAKAVASCVTGDYTYVNVAGARSGSGDDNTSEATCPDGFKLTGCTCHSWWRSCDGSMPDGETCKAYESGGGSGVEAHARCVKSGTYGPEK
jgi:hypothetical protein